jgi:hypothetical protein
MTDDLLINDSTIGQHAIGKVGSPSGKEATSDQFYFWVDRNALVESTQIIRTSSIIGGQEFRFFALVEQVYRVSDKANIADEWGATDGNSEEEATFNGQGVTYASARILRADPAVFTPPLEQSKVYVCNDDEAGLAYGSDENEAPLTLGKIKNGGNVLAGSGQIDMNYLIGVSGGHMNVNGVAGRGTKSSFLLYTIYMMLQEAERQAKENPGDPTRLQVVPIILNVKGYDLFYIDRWNKNYNPEKHAAAWTAMGIEHPHPFTGVRFFAPQMPNADISVPTGSRGTVEAFSWSLSDVIENGLMMYLFASEDAEDMNFSALVLDIESWLTQEDVQPDGTLKRKLRSNPLAFLQKTSQKAIQDKNVGAAEKDEQGTYFQFNGNSANFNPDAVPQSFAELAAWVKNIYQEIPQQWNSHHTGTWRKLHRRLIKLLHEGKGVLRRDDLKGKPLNLVIRQNSAPIVIDLNSLAKVPGLQRFVVATIFNQLLEDRTGPNAVNGLVYLVALDELNRFAPRGAKDAITKLIETVAAEMRSVGIILLGAQQQASKISERVFENAGIHVVGRSGSLEMSQPMWRFLNEKTRAKAAILQSDEKLLVQDSFREPMHVRVPFPVWAMRSGEAQAGESNSDEATDDTPTGLITY